MVDLAQNTVKQVSAGTAAMNDSTTFFSPDQEVGLRDRTALRAEAPAGCQQHIVNAHELFRPWARRDAAIQNLPDRLRHAHGPHERDQGEPGAAGQRNEELLALRCGSSPTSSRRSRGQQAPNPKRSARFISRSSSRTGSSRSWRHSESHLRGGHGPSEHDRRRSQSRSKLWPVRSGRSPAI